MLLHITDQNSSPGYRFRMGWWGYAKRQEFQCSASPAARSAGPQEKSEAASSCMNIEIGCQGADVRQEKLRLVSPGDVEPLEPYIRARPKRCFGEFVGRFRFDFVLHQRRNEDRAKENENKTKTKNIVQVEPCLASYRASVCQGRTLLRVNIA